MAIDGIGEPSLRPPATIPFDDDDNCHPDEYEYDEEEVEMATAIAISDKELEEEYRSRIFETAVQAKVMEEVEQVPPPNRCRAPHLAGGVEPLTDVSSSKNRRASYQTTHHKQ